MACLDKQMKLKLRLGLFCCLTSSSYVMAKKGQLDDVNSIFFLRRRRHRRRISSFSLFFIRLFFLLPKLWGSNFFLFISPFSSCRSLIFFPTFVFKPTIILFQEPAALLFQTDAFIYKRVWLLPGGNVHQLDLFFLKLYALSLSFSLSLARVNWIEICRKGRRISFIFVRK